MSIEIVRQVVCDDCGEIAPHVALESENPRALLPDGLSIEEEEDEVGLIDLCPNCAGQNPRKVAEYGGVK